MHFMSGLRVHRYIVSSYFVFFLLTLALVLFSLTDIRCERPFQRVEAFLLSRFGYIQEEFTRTMFLQPLQILASVSMITRSARSAL